MTPPDKNQCQAKKTAGYNFMTLGGRVGEMVRCTNKPIVIATEAKLGTDDQFGSMSLCAECLNAFIEQTPKGYAIFSDPKDLPGT